MRATQFVFNAAKKKKGISIPVELTPLFAAMSIALFSGSWFTYKKFAFDDSLRITGNPRQSGLEEVLKEEK